MSSDQFLKDLSQLIRKHEIGAEDALHTANALIFSVCSMAANFSSKKV